MSDPAQQRFPIMWIVVVFLVGAYAYWLSGQIDESQSQLRAAQERERQLVDQLQTVAASRPAQATPGTVPEALLVALLRRPDLIPFEGEVGGRFYYLEDSVRALPDDMLYVTVEDGHVQGHLLLQYSSSGDRTDFTVVAAARD